MQSVIVWMSREKSRMTEVEQRFMGLGVAISGIYQQMIEAI